MSEKNKKQNTSYQRKETKIRIIIEAIITIEIFKAIIIKSISDKPTLAMRLFGEIEMNTTSAGLY